MPVFDAASIANAAFWVYIAVITEKESLPMKTKDFALKVSVDGTLPAKESRAGIEAVVKKALEKHFKTD